MHQPKVDFNQKKKKIINLNQICNKKLKIHQKKEKKNRQREYSLVCVGKIYIVWKKEKKIIVKKNEKKSQNKRNMKGWRN